MGSRLSSVDEMRLTHAIEKAATLASVSDADRSGILSEQLIKADVDPKFAKVASAAFNKRLTVLTLEKTADEHKADPFPLADAAVVCEMMGGDADGGVFRKSASYDPSTGAFEISFEAYRAPVMRKAASMPRHVNMEERLDYRQLQEKVGSLMDRNAAAYQELSHKMSTLDSMLNKQAAELSSMLCSAEGSDFLLDRLNEIHGPGFSAELMSRMPADMPKRAHAANPVDIYRKADEFSCTCGMFSEYGDFMDSYGEGLAGIGKAASELGDHCAKAELYGLTKEAESTPGLIAGLQVLKAGVDETADAITATGKAMGAIYNTTKGTVGGALQAYDELRKRDRSPYDFMDAGFITRDRQRDRLMAFTDMAADPSFSMYPAEQVFSAANTIMDTDKELESPARREMLRSQLGQLLSQNGRQSTADIAATAATLKAFNDAAAKGRSISALQAVKELSDVKGTAGGVPDALLSAGNMDFSLLDMSSSKQTADKALESVIVALEKQNESEAKAKERAEELAYKQQMIDYNHAMSIYREKKKDYDQTQRDAKADQRNQEQLTKLDQRNQEQLTKLDQRNQEQLTKLDQQRKDNENREVARVNRAAASYSATFDRERDAGLTQIQSELANVKLNAGKNKASRDAAVQAHLQTVKNTVEKDLFQHRGNLMQWLSSPAGAACLGMIDAISDSRLGSNAITDLRLYTSSPGKGGNARFTDRSISTLLAEAGTAYNEKARQFSSFDELADTGAEAKRTGGFNPMTGGRLSSGSGRGGRP